MLEFLLPALALLAASASLLTWRPAPSWSGLWKVALAVGEFGHWLVLFPIGLGVLAFATEGWTRVVTLALATMAALQLLRPAVLASRIGSRLPEQVQGAFGGNASGRAFSWRRLFFHDRMPRAKVETAVFVRAGEVELGLDFYLPVRRSEEPAPCLVVVHGGGWDGGDRLQLAEWNHRWAGRGYGVAAVSYRLAPCHNWPAPREDVITALDWLKRNAVRLGIDASRIVLIGRSAGGQIAGAIAYGSADPAIVGLISYYAPQDMQFAWSVSREDDALNSIKLMRQYLGGPPDTPERKALYDSASAQRMVGPGTPPTLLLHGRPDTLVWHRHSDRLVARLREAGVPHLYLELPWATHGFDFNLDGPGGQLADFAIENFLRAVTVPSGPRAV